MKRLYFAAAVLLLMVAACVKATPEPAYEQDETLYRTGKVTLLASIEDLSTKAEMPGTGHGVWKAGDEIAVQTTDGDFVTFSLDGTGDTKRAKFVAELPSGKTLGNYAVYPASAVVSGTGDDIKVKMPSTYSADYSDCPAVMVATIGDSFAITFKQTMAYMTLALSQVPVTATSIVLSESGRSLAGEFPLNLPVASATGVTAPVGDGTLTITLPKAASTLNMMVPVPVADYKTLTATIYDQYGDKVTSETIIDGTTSLDRAAVKTITKTLKEVKVVSNYITLRGITWCKGNLQRNSSASATGWQPGWELASSQWYTYNYDLKSYGKYTYDPSGPSEMRFDVNTDFCNHFNFGGIESPFTITFATVAQPSGSASICGKMYTDAACTSETTDFAAAKFGDLAYWASMGQYRMPTAAELTKLTECDSQFGYFLTDDNMKVWGTLFTEPATEGLPVKNTVETQLTSDDLDSGLFLPLAGRHPDSNMLVIKYRTEGVYMSGDTLDKSTVSGATASSDYEYSTILDLTSSAVLVGTKGGAYDRRSGFCIRPVLN